MSRNDPHYQGLNLTEIAHALPQDVRDTLYGVLTHPGGQHGWEWQTVCALRGAGINDPDTLLALLEEHCREERQEQWLRLIDQTDPVAALDGPVVDPASLHPLDLHGDHWRGAGGWPAPSPEHIEMAVADGMKRLDAAQRGSKPCLVPPDERGHSPKFWLERLWGVSPLLWLCAGRDAKSKPMMRQIGEWNDELLATLPLVVPNPALKPVGLTKSGARSHRCRDNFNFEDGQRRFIVVEFDREPDKDRQLALLMSLSNFGSRLSIVVDSGNKSLHGWFGLNSVTTIMELRRWFAYAVLLGADPVTWKPEQYVRMPQGTRVLDDGRVKRQRVILTTS